MRVVLAIKNGKQVTDRKTWNGPPAPQAPVPKAVLVKRGEEHPTDVSLAELKEMHRREPPGKSRERLQAAVLRKQGRMLEKIARVMGRGVSTIHRWLSRMEREGPDGRHDGKSPGRPRLLNPEQEKVVEGDLDGTPRDSGFERGSWNARMVARRISDRFGVPYSSRSAIRLAHRLGFSFRKPRPVPWNGATPEEPTEFINKGRSTAARWRAEGRTVVAVDAATLRDSPVSRRGSRRRGGRETVPVNHSKQSIHMIGALGDGTLDLQFHDDLSAGSYVELVEHLRRRYGKVGIVADNAGALTGRGMRKCLDDADGAVEMLHLPPRTPQLNPIEVEWREIKAAVADIFFDGLDRMRDAIRRMIRNGEIPIVKMFDWLLAA